MVLREHGAWYHPDVMFKLYCTFKGLLGASGGNSIGHWGHVPPPLLQMAGHGDTVSRRRATRYVELPVADEAKVLGVVLDRRPIFENNVTMVAQSRHYHAQASTPFTVNRAGLTFTFTFSSGWMTPSKMSSPSAETTARVQCATPN